MKFKILKSNRIAYWIPPEATNIKVEKFRDYFHVDYDLPRQPGYTVSGGFAIMFNVFGGRKKYPDEILIIRKIGHILLLGYSKTQTT